jgi:hypothetical protein
VRSSQRNGARTEDSTLRTKEEVREDAKRALFLAVEEPQRQPDVHVNKLAKEDEGRRELARQKEQAAFIDGSLPSALDLKGKPLVQKATAGKKEEAAPQSSPAPKMLSVPQTTRTAPGSSLTTPSPAPNEDDLLFPLELEIQALEINTRTPAPTPALATPAPETSNIGGKKQAATKIQSLFRGRKARNEFKTLKAAAIRCTCGNIFRHGAKFCGECGAERPEALQIVATICSCGHEFTPECLFCRSCGKQRPTTVIET